MGYGNEIKAARQILGIFQKDIASEHLSRNLLSDIEKNKVTLVPSKALIIYRKIVIIAWRKNIYYDLNFDEVLKEQPNYWILKEANARCYQLNQILNHEKKYDEQFVNDTMNFANGHDIDELRFHLYCMIARIHHQQRAYEEATKAFINALEFLKWQKNEAIYVLYKNCLREGTKTLYCSGKFEHLEKFTSHFVQLCEELSLKVESKWYYNLSLYHQKLQDYEKSLLFMDKYLCMNQYDHPEDQFDGMIINACNHVELGQIYKGLDFYKGIISIDSKSSLQQKRIALSNIIFVIAKYALDSEKDALESYMDALGKLMEDAEQAYGMATFNIGMGNVLLGHHDEAIQMILKGLEIMYSHQDFNELVEALDESYNYLIQKDHVEDVVKYVLSVKAKALEKNDYKRYLKLVIKVQCQMDIEKHSSMFRKLQTIEKLLEE